VSIQLDIVRLQYTDTEFIEEEEEEEMKSQDWNES
jgi:hypothetical protein